MKFSFGFSLNIKLLLLTDNGLCRLSWTDCTGLMDCTDGGNISGGVGGNIDWEFKGNIGGVVDSTIGWGFECIVVRVTLLFGAAFRYAFRLTFLFLH